MLSTRLLCYIWIFNIQGKSYHIKFRTQISHIVSTFSLSKNQPKTVKKDIKFQPNSTQNGKFCLVFQAFQPFPPQLIVSSKSLPPHPEMGYLHIFRDICLFKFCPPPLFWQLRQAKFLQVIYQAYHCASKLGCEIGI